jgi:hypothetical protein
MRLNRVHVIPGRGCVCGVVGSSFLILPDQARVRNRCVSQSGLERPVIEGDNPVDENSTALVEDTRVAAGP